MRMGDNSGIQCHQRKAGGGGGVRGKGGRIRLRGAGEDRHALICVTVLKERLPGE